MNNCYIHIPFCDLKCKYCRFASIGKIQNLHIEKYVNFLCKEISDFKLKNKQIDTIYFGGGTPSILSKKKLGKILNTLRKKFIFNKNIEITLESTPNNITLENLEIWQKLGINRLSVGIQTFNKKSLKEINRGKKGDIKKALKNLEKFRKIKNISFDFIIGLPYVKKGETLEEVKFLLKNYKFIKHISIYMLEDYYSQDKIIENKFDKITYPKLWKNYSLKENHFLLEYSSIKKFLEKKGFINYEISNFGKKGYFSKHNIGYWTHKNVFAFGLGASSFIENKRFANSDNFKDYYLNKKNFEYFLTKDDLFLEKIMFGLRTNGLNQEIYKKLNQEKINFFLEEGYLFFKKNILKLTNKGVLVLDYILKEIS